MKANGERENEMAKMLINLSNSRNENENNERKRKYL